MPTTARFDRRGGVAVLSGALPLLPLLPRQALLGAAGARHPASNGAPDTSKDF